MYKLVRDIMTNELADVILKPSENLAIPKDLNNYRYQEYLEWVADGNTPEPADE